jgi:hypothetical protein
MQPRLRTTHLVASWRGRTVQPLWAVDGRANGTDGNGTVPFLSGQKWADRRDCPAGVTGGDVQARLVRTAKARCSDNAALI